MAFRPSIVEQNFDSHFDSGGPGRAARLRIKLKVTLAPLDPLAPAALTSPSAPLPAAMSGATIPPSHLAAARAANDTGNVMDASNRLVPCRRWLASEWAAFVPRFKSSVEHAWNNQMIFLPTESGLTGDGLSDEDYKALIGNPRIPAHVAGELEIEIMPAGTIGHALIEVAHLAAPGANFRDRMSRITDESVIFERNTFKFGQSRGVTGETGQLTAAHEVGHWLRGPTGGVFDHIDRTFALTLATRREQDRAQYGKTLGRYYSLMGGGSVAGEHEASAWINRLRRHSTMKGGWTYIHKIHFGRMWGDIPERQRRLVGG